MSFDNLGTNVVVANEDDISSAFGPSAEEVAAGKNKNKDKTKDKTKDVKPAIKKSTSSKENTDQSSKKVSISDFSDDDDKDLFNSDDEDDEAADEENEDDEPVEDDEEVNKKKKKKVAKKEEEEEDTDDDEPSDDDENNDDDEPADDENEDDEPADEDEQVADFLQKRAELLIKKGQWVDFEGREDFEWNEDNFAELEIQQRNYQKDKIVEEVLDSFGPTGREIATYVANGGNPDDLIDIFKEQQRVENLSVDNEDAQKAVVLKYETEFLGKKPERVKKYIDSLIADKDLKEAATEAKEAMEANLAEKATALQEEQEATVKEVQQKQKAEIQKFSNNVSAIINADKSIPADEKTQLLKVLTKFDKRLPNGTPVNEFYNRFAEFKKDLSKYITMVRFVMNPDKFTKGLKTAGKNEGVEQSFKLARSSKQSKKIKSRELITGKVGKTKFQLL